MQARSQVEQLELVRSTHDQEEEVEEEEEEEEVEEEETKICSATRNYLSTLNPSSQDDRLYDSDITSFHHLITMGQFMDQVSKLSILIDSIRLQLDDNLTNLIQDSTLRSNLYRSIQDQIIDRFLKLNRAFIHSPSPSISIPPPTTTSTVDPQDPIDHRSEKLPLISRDAHQIEYQLKLDQIRTLHSNLNSILLRLLSVLKNERQIIIDQIEFEWTKELNPPTHQHPQSILPSSTPIDPIHHPSSDPSHFQALTQLALDHTNRQPTSELHSELVLKRLKVAVRNSTSYPQARRSSIFIQSQLQLAQQLQSELLQLDSFIQTISQQPRSRSSSLPDDSSSVSMSLDGLDIGEHDFKRPYKSQPRITFELPSKADQHGTTYPKDYNVVDLENNFSDPRRSFVPSNYSYHSAPATLCGFPASRKRCMILACCVASLILIVVAVAVFLVLSMHDT